MQGTVVHLQDARLATRAKISKGEIDWAKMTLEGQGVEEGQIDSSGSQQSNMAQIDLMLYRFIEHRQLFEFIEVYKVYLKGDQKLTEAPENLGGKTFLHLAVEHSATEIVSYLLLDAKVDPNVLSHNSQMGVLHVAVSFQRNDLIDLILMSERTDINLMSSLHGTPLHLACKIGNLKIVQQLLINGADIFLKSLKNGKLAKDSTDNQRIVFLIEKYEKLRALEQEGDESAGSSEEEAEDDGNTQNSSEGAALINMLKRSSSLSQLGTSSSGLGQIDEDEHENYDENILEHLEKHAGSALDQAQQYLEDFQKSRVEVLPVIQGNLFAQGSLNKK